MGFLVGCGSSTTSTVVTITDEELTARQDAIIQQYLKEKNITNWQKHSTGFYYHLTTDNNNTNPVFGDSLAVNYTGSLIYGKVFDSNLTRNNPEPYAFRYLRERSTSSSAPLVAFQDASGLLAKGEKGIFYMPSRLMYKSSGVPPLIHPNAILVFEIEMVNIFKF